MGENISNLNPDINTLVEKKPKEKSNTLVMIALILMMLIIAGAAYLFFTDKLDIGIDNPFKKEVGSNLEDETSGYVMKNKGWGLFSVSEYGFSSEIPSYTMEQKNIYGSDVTSYWSAFAYKNSSNTFSLYPDYLTTIALKFYPVDLYGFNCGGGCVKEHLIWIYVFENKGSKSLTEVKDIFSEKIKEGYEEENDYKPVISEEVEEKWGHEVISFIEPVASDFNSFDGKIVVTSDFVYILKYYLSDEPVESNKVAQKVLDSFVFSK